MQDPNFQDSVKRNITSAADTVQKAGLAGYQALGKQVTVHTGVQIPGVGPTNSLGGSPSVQRNEHDYDDFWAENGIKDVGPKETETSSFAGHVKTANGAKGNAKDDEWENW